MVIIGNCVYFLMVYDYGNHHGDNHGKKKYNGSNNGDVIYDI